MSVDDGVAVESFRLRSAHEVLPDYLEHLRADVSSPPRKIADTEGYDGQDQVLHPIEDASAPPHVVHPADRERRQSPLPKLRREEENQQQRQPKGGHREGGNRQNRNRVVEPRASFGRRVDS